MWVLIFKNIALQEKILNIMSELYNLRLQIMDGKNVNISLEKVSTSHFSDTIAPQVT